MTTYTITVTNEMNTPAAYAEYLDTTTNKQQAVQTAKQWAKDHADKIVLIGFDRKSDGQQGFLNKDGFSLTGDSWTD